MSKRFTPKGTCSPSSCGFSNSPIINGCGGLIVMQKFRLCLCVALLWGLAFTSMAGVAWGACADISTVSDAAGLVVSFKDARTATANILGADEGRLVYDSADKALKICDGDDWQFVGNTGGVVAVYSAGGMNAASVTLQNDNIMHVMPDTTVNFTLLKSVFVGFHGGFSGACDTNPSSGLITYVVFRLKVNGVVKAQSFASGGQYCANNLDWYEKLPAGTYTALLEYRTNMPTAVRNHSPNSGDSYTRGLQVVVYSAP